MLEMIELWKSKDQQGCSWVKFDVQNRCSFISAGTALDQTLLGIGRVIHGSEIIPGKVFLRHGICHFTQSGKELTTKDFTALKNSAEFYWEKWSFGLVPPNAVIGGVTSNGEELYVGRANHQGLIIPGKICTSEKCIYLPYDQKEHKKRNYEVLVRIPEVDFKSITNTLPLCQNFYKLKVKNCPSIVETLQSLASFETNFSKDDRNACCIEFKTLSGEEDEKFIYESLEQIMKTFSKFLISFELIEQSSFLIFWRLEDSSDILWLKISKDETIIYEKLHNFVVKFILKELDKNSNAIHDSVMEKLRKGHKLCLEVLSDSDGYDLLSIACEENEIKLVKFFTNIFNTNLCLRRQIAADSERRNYAFYLANQHQYAFKLNELMKVYQISNPNGESTIHLLARSNVEWFDSDTLSKLVVAFNLLNKNCELNYLLNFLATKSKFQIIFDFKSDHDKNDPFTNKLFRKRGKIYIAAKNLINEPEGEKYFEALGEVAKKFWQYYYYCVCGTDYCPYKRACSKNENWFSEIFHKCNELKNVEKCFKSVYECEREDQQSELIACYPQLLARYINQPERIEELERQFVESFGKLKEFHNRSNLTNLELGETLNEEDELDDCPFELEPADVNFWESKKFKIAVLFFGLLVLTFTMVLFLLKFPCFYRSCGNYPGVECLNQGFMKFECHCPKDFKFESKSCHECLYGSDCRKNFTCHLKSCVNELNLHYCDNKGNEKILKQQLCNGEEDCRDGSDEKVCVQGEVKYFKAYSPGYLLTFEPFDNLTITTEDFTINSDYNENVKSFYIKENKKFEFLPVKIAKKFLNLIEFRVIDSGIKKIKAETFKNLNFLIILHLYFNKIETIEEKSFDDLKLLQELNFEDNLITYLPPEIFFTLNKLKKINLSHNQLANFDANFFEYNRRLETIKLRGTGIKKVNENLIECLNDIICIDLSENICIKMVYGECYQESTPINLKVRNELKKDLLENCGNKTEKV